MGIRKKRKTSKIRRYYKGVLDLKKLISVLLVFVMMIVGGVSSLSENKELSSLINYGLNEIIEFVGLEEYVKEYADFFEKHQYVSLDNIPEYTNKPYVYINNNKPYFSEEELVVSDMETYESLDVLGRCKEAYACLSYSMMPSSERESIYDVKPTGWHSVSYDFIDGGSLYNRCHLIGFQLAGENANERNLITGTRYMNVEGMLPFENEIATYIKKTKHHVLYRVTPIFEGVNLVASGVLLEAQSIEDNRVSFCVYVYNVQPGVDINYLTGYSSLQSGQ